MMGEDFDNPWGRTTKKGSPIQMSTILNSAVFPGMQGGPLEHVIAAKAVGFGEALTDEYTAYCGNVIENAQAMSAAFIEMGYHVISGGTDNHLMLIDLRNKGVTGKQAEEALIKADITVNKNMVPFDDQSPFVTSGIRVGTAAMTTRDATPADCKKIATWIDRIITNHTDDSLIAGIKEEVNAYAKGLKLYADE
jgi:glycine hydroxymethyltransferase